MADRFFSLKVSDVRMETDECVSVAFEVPENLEQTFAFRAGQYVTLQSVIDGESIRRSYSICTSPADEELRVAIKRVVSGKFSTFANTSLKVGDQLELMPPDGRFVADLDASQVKQYLMVAAGSGITPIIALIKSILAVEPQSRVTLLYGNKTRANVIFKELLASLKNQYFSRFSVFHIFSREQSETTFSEGRLTAQKVGQFLETILPASQLDEIFICGPETLAVSLRKALLNAGLESRQIHIELFGTQARGSIPRRKANSTSRDAEALAKVTVKVDGASIHFAMETEGESLLDAALRCGADLPYACKGGVCTTCKAKLESGEVEMDVNYGLEPDEVEAGFVLTCQSHPRSDSVVVNYDIR